MESQSSRLVSVDLFASIQEEYRTDGTPKVHLCGIYYLLCCEKLQNQVGTVLHTIDKGFAFIGGTEAAAEVENGIIIVQGEVAEELFQFLKFFANLWRIRFVRFCVDLV